MVDVKNEITLRDLIALTVLHAEISARKSMGFLPDIQSRDAYKMADAMLAERTKETSHD